MYFSIPLSYVDEEVHRTFANKNGALTGKVQSKMDSAGNQKVSFFLKTMRSTKKGWREAEIEEALPTPRAARTAASNLKPPPQSQPTKMECDSGEDVLLEAVDRKIRQAQEAMASDVKSALAGLVDQINGLSLHQQQQQYHQPDRIVAPLLYPFLFDS